MSYAAARDTLINNQYTPLPVMPSAKAPAIKRLGPNGWGSPDYIPPNGYQNYSVGLACGLGEVPIVAVDLDIHDQALADKVEQQIKERFGAAPVRYGNPPKRLLLYRAAVAGYRKRRSSETEVGHVEIMGDGQQIVAFGIHPDTKRPYRWQGINPTTVPASELPELSESDLSSVLDIFHVEAAKCGFKAPEAPKATAPGFDPEDPLDQVAPLGKNPEELHGIMAPLDPDCPRDVWIKSGMALHHETGGSPEGLAIWEEWSAKGSKYKEGEPAAQWESFGRYPGRPITAAYLLKLAKDTLAVDPGFWGSLNWSVDRFVDAPEPMPMIIEGLLPKGIVGLIYSAGGAGKSTLTLYQCAKIAACALHPGLTDFLGHTIRGGRVAIITAEDPDLVLNHRFVGVLQAIADEIGIPLAEVRALVRDNLKIVSTFGRPVQLFAAKPDGTVRATDYYTGLRDKLEKIDNLQLVIIDTKTRYSSGEGLGNVTATQELTYYEEIASRTGASVLLLHHSNKASRNGSQTGIQAYRDATALFDTARACWYLRGLTAKEIKEQGIPPEDEGKYLLYETAKNNYLPPIPTVMLRRDGYGYRVHAQAPKMTQTEKKDRQDQEVFDKVIDIMQTAKGASYGLRALMVLCQEQAIGRRKLEKALDTALSLGFIDKMKAATGRAHEYFLTEEGKMHNLNIAGEIER